jgi:nucleoside-diphosphate-sugar epimerase
MDADANSSELVTGARGFVGRAVVKLLQREGYRVVALDTSATAAAGDDRESAGNIECDINDADELRRVFRATPIRGIIHLAAILPTAAQREPLRATEVNVTGSVHLLEMARQFGVRRFVLGSSLSVYGTCAADQTISESDRAAPEDLYGAAKAYIERLGQAYDERHDVEFVGLRIGRVVGPGSKSKTSAWRSEIFELLGSNQPVEITLPYVGSERLLLVHVDDVASMLMALLQASHPAHGLYNAPCESMIVADLKREVEAVNGNISVSPGDAFSQGNPRLLDSSRFQREFAFEIIPLVTRLRSAARLLSSSEVGA